MDVQLPATEMEAIGGGELKISITFSCDEKIGDMSIKPNPNIKTSSAIDARRHNLIKLRKMWNCIKTFV